MRSHTHWLSLLVLLTLCLPALPVRAALALPKEIPGLSRVRTVERPVVSLRGYGSLGGEFVEFATPAGERASVLTLTCADAARAGIVLAKYRADLQCLGGVTVQDESIGRYKAPLAVVDGQGSLLALRQGATVLILAAQRMPEFARLVKALKIAGQRDLDFLGGEVPVYLDKFDKYGWSFWYQTGATPPKQEETYDIRQDFDFLKRLGLGMQIQLGHNRMDTAVGVIDYAGCGWAIEYARQLGIPVFIQPFAFTGPLWLANKYPAQMIQKMPQFVGNFYSPGANHGYTDPAHIAWTAREAKDIALDGVSQIVRRYKSYPNITGYSEAHGEIAHATPDVFTEYGPEADAVYRGFLREKYATPQAVDARWHGGRQVISTWEDVRVPEVASFLGWGPGAIDLQGTWRTAYDKEFSAEVAARWQDPTLDDSAWRTIVAPGDDRYLWRPRQEAGILRRTVTLSEEQVKTLTEAGKCYLYIWSLERNTREKLTAALNGTLVGEFSIPSWRAAWCAFEVSGALRAGANNLALHTPNAFLAYRIYLSPRPPKCYPELGIEENSRWVDFRDFVTWTRAESLRRGMEAIRREDPDRYIKLMAPSSIIGQGKALSEEFGGAFHDTGGMAGTWSDYLPAVARGAGMPFTAEPGGPASDLPGLKRMVGMYATEGVNAVDYFIHLGSITWNPPQKAWFEENLPLIHLFGKYHAKPAQVAVLHGERSEQLIGYPWDQINTQLLWHNRNKPLHVEGMLPHPRDVIVETDFARGPAARYKVIIDDNTMIMDEALIDRIDAWVRAGGIFIATGHGGRHTPETPNAWPINRLTGYRVIGFNDNLRYGGLPGQQILTNPYWFQQEAKGRPALGGAGLLLEKVAPECTDVLGWETTYGKSGVAMGVRPLGKGYVVTMGTQVTARGWEEILRWCGVPVAIPVTPDCRLASYVSNNGLYDVHVLFADGVKAEGTTSITLPGTGAPAALKDLLSGKTLTGVASKDGMRFEGIAVTPWETRPYLAPHGHLVVAPLAWLELQRNWWKGTRVPAPAPKLPVDAPESLNLSEDWAFSPVPAGTDGATLASPDVDDTGWERQNLGIWDVAKHGAIKRGIFRKRFTAPAAWAGTGRAYLNLHGANAVTLRPPYTATVYLDGQVIWSAKSWRYAAMEVEITALLTPGSHLLAVEAESNSAVGGVPGGMWIEFVPEPALRQSLAGSWGAGVDLPGQVKLTGARRAFVPDPRGQGKSVQLYVECVNLSAVFINGKFLPRMNVPFGSHFRFNLTPYIKWGEENTLQLNPHYPDAQQVKVVEVRYD
jgi:hypothetical protein